MQNDEGVVGALTTFPSAGTIVDKPPTLPPQRAGAAGGADMLMWGTSTEAALAMLGVVGSNSTAPTVRTAGSEGLPKTEQAMVHQAIASVATVKPIVVGRVAVAGQQNLTSQKSNQWFNDGTGPTRPPTPVGEAICTTTTGRRVRSTAVVVSYAEMHDGGSADEASSQHTFATTGTIESGDEAEFNIKDVDTSGTVH